jgi:hypothetical protein
MLKLFGVGHHSTLCFVCEERGEFWPIKGLFNDKSKQSAGEESFCHFVRKTFSDDLVAAEGSKKRPIECIASTKKKEK